MCMGTCTLTIVSGADGAGVTGGLGGGGIGVEPHCPEHIRGSVGVGVCVGGSGSGKYYLPLILSKDREGGAMCW
jgi:hypothetical protein